jgi:hypothetical protein
MNGHREGSVPDKYAGGIAESGVEELRKFVKEGGTLIALNASCQFLIDQFQLPLRNISRDYPTTEFFCPSAILKIELDNTHPIAYGMGKNADILCFNSPLLDFIKSDDMSNNNTYLSLENLQIVGKYDNKNPFRSGRLIGDNILYNKPVLIEAKYGKGKLVLFVFRPQNRAQTHGTFMLFFNSLYYGQAKIENSGS